ncbi:luc7-like protein 3 [Thrips palmi]|uniref:Luc7-like protein 3 n=1 Tax=Thrips palmi TaxID=161013 RepID=A0A6P8ZP57_THRPL|nr:luc7-like protein 3 [Thrips palmi]XP_034243525.1 luc7-like protein 3 [Thrips palmi]
MAVLAAAALLDELMGRNRNALGDKQKDLNWEDPEFCKMHMVKFCPHDLFVNTRADLGACSRLHDDEAKNQYEKSTSYKKQQYEDDFVRFCQGMVSEVERKIAKGKSRLALITKADTASLTPAQTQQNTDQINLLSEKINNLVSEAEQMGTQGNVEKAQGLMKLCDQLKEEREQLRKQNDNSHWQQTADLAAAQEKQMEVCDVCGAFLIVGDAQSRIDDHLMGKQHMGYARLRSAIEEIQSNRTKAREEKEKRREEERRERYKARDEEEKKKEREREERRKRREEEEASLRRRNRERSPGRHRRRSRSRDRERPARHDDRHGREPRDRDKEKHRGSSMQGGRDWKNSYRGDRGDEQYEYRREDDRDRHRREKGMNGEASRHSSKSHHHHSNRSHHREEYEEENSRSRRIQDAYDEDHINSH